MAIRSILLFLLLIPVMAWSSNGLLNTDPFSELATEEPEFLHVDEAYVFSSSVAGQELIVTWKIAEGYYLYKNRMKVAAPDGVTFDEVKYSKQGKDKHDEYFGLVQVFYDSVEMRIPVQAVPQGDAEFTITYQGCAEAGLCYPPQKRKALFIGEASSNASLTPGNQSSANSTPSSNTGSPETTQLSSNTQPASQQLSNTFSQPNGMNLLVAIGFAFLGGLILNLMPCVFPVLSLKALKLAKASGQEHHHNRVQALYYTAGVVSLFLLVAMTLIALRAGGESIGWGFQMQSPWFVGFLVYLLFILGLSLVGWLEIGTQMMGIGDNLANSGGNKGAFFTGALAVIVATPCTAPFMGSALGYAITLNPFQAVLVFSSLGLGMSLPFLIIGFVPGAAKLLPKPGPWMETFKQFLAFPLFLSALWLIWVLGKQTGIEGMSWVLLGMIMIVFSIWLYQGSLAGKQFNRWSRRIVAAGSAITALGLLSYPTIISSQSSMDLANKPFEAFSKNKLETLQKSGKTVFVNVTADWCVSCLVNEKTVLSTKPVAPLLASDQVTYLKGDWTNADTAITHYLESFGRNGVPMYVIYKAGHEPKLLPQILTSDVVMEALEESQPL